MMKRFISGFLRTILFTAAGIFLFLAALLLLLYSPWAQHALLERLTQAFSSKPGTELRVESLSLSFPIDLKIKGLLYISENDTLVKADELRADICLLPLLAGRVDVDEVFAGGVIFKNGDPDSTYMRVSADTLLLKPCVIKLTSMDIDLHHARLAHARVFMKSVESVDTTPTDTTRTHLGVRVRNLELSDFAFTMQAPGIDSLGATLADLRLNEARVDLYEQTVDVNSLGVNGWKIAFLASPVSGEAAEPAEPEEPAADEETSPPWTIRLTSLSMDGGDALYTTAGTEPLPGFDPAYIYATNVNLSVDSLYNCGTDIHVPLRLSALERCGLDMNLHGTFDMDSTGIHARGFNLSTPASSIDIDAMLGNGDLATEAVPLALETLGSISFADLRMAFPGYALYMQGFRDNPLQLDIDLDGTSRLINIDRMLIAANHTLRMNVEGSLTDILTDQPGADLDLTGNIMDVRALISSVTGGGVSVPAMGLNGHFNMRRGVMDGSLTALTTPRPGGELALDARLDGNTDAYNIDLRTDRFPVNAFMPDLGVGEATMHLTATGNGFDLMSEATQLSASLEVDSITYEGYKYTDATLRANIADGNADITADVNSADCVASVTAHGNLIGDTYDWTADIDASALDLYAMHLSETPTTLAMRANATASIGADGKDITAALHVPSVTYTDDMLQYRLSDIAMRFVTNDTITGLGLDNRDLHLQAAAYCSLDSIGARFSRAMAEIDREIDERKITVDTISRLLPQFDLELVAGADNLINDVLAQQKSSIGSLNLRTRNDSTLMLRGLVTDYRSPGTVLDSIQLNLEQEADRMKLRANVDNRPGTNDEWAHIAATGMLDSNSLAMRVTQSNIERKTGYDVGVIAVAGDSTVTGRLFPITPMIAYRQWRLNLDNHITYNFYNNHIDASLDLRGQNSLLSIKTIHPKEECEHPDSISDINVRIENLQLSEFMPYNPFATPFDGTLSADLDIEWDGGAGVNGSGNVGLADFVYDRQRVGSVLADVDLSTNAQGTIRAAAEIDIDGYRAMSLSGNLNDTIPDSPFGLDLDIIRLPLTTVNPFLGADLGRLSGTLVGNLHITGDTEQPRMNGEIRFDSTYVNLTMTNTAYALSQVPIPMVDNVVTFNNFTISGANENPLAVNGTVDLSSLSDPRFNLQLTAANMMLVNTRRASKNADVFGKLYVNLDATVRGSSRLMMLRADLGILAGTNLTYVLKDSPSQYTAASMTDMVKFVNLSDSSAVAQADSISDTTMLTIINAALDIQSGTSITVDLPSSTRDKVVIQPQGKLNYTQSPMAEGRMTGRLNIDGGNVHYTVPVIGAEKDFTFQQGSYVAFNGDILNPVLNIHAVDVLKANVTQNGANSRVINFDVQLNVTGTLNTMDVAFDLSTDDDLTVANELQSMTPEQRANQAMNMLIYNVYTGPSTSASANLTANPLYSFLESTINNWAANNIKGVDVSFGINQYDQTTDGATSSTMNYSYRVSKSLFNDRFKIVVGGNYSTDDNADENLSQNLINDISFEYYLNARQTMLLKLFRHTGFESILEGEVTQTGVGFVYRRKINSMMQMLPKFMRPKRRN